MCLRTMHPPSNPRQAHSQRTIFEANSRARSARPYPPNPSPRQLGKILVAVGAVEDLYIFHRPAILRIGNAHAQQQRAAGKVNRPLQPTKT